MSATANDSVGKAPSHGARTEIGGCTLDRVIGSGATGVVWAGTQKRDGKKVAIKLLRASGDVAARASLRARIAAASAIDDDNVARVLAVGCDDDRDYVVMEQVLGQSLADWLALAPPARAIADALLAAGRGLLAGHRASVVHGNFTLHSAIRTNDGRVAVTDFGMAKGQLDPKADHKTSAVAVAKGRGSATVDGDAPPPRQQHELLDAALWQGGAFIGTPGYMAPELLAGGAANEHSDQFAFCVAFWEAWTGKRPFVASSLDELAAAAQRGSPQPPAEMPAAVARALLRGLAADPKRRWPSLEDLLGELQGSVSRRSNGLALPLGAVLAVACLATLVALLRC